MDRIDSKQGPLDPVFGQHTAFALNDEGVSPNVIRYLLDVRNEALTSSSLHSSSRTEQNSHNVVETVLVADTSDLLNASSILEDSEAINEWINEIREEMKPLEESPSDFIYTDDMLDLLVSEIKKYLDQHPEELNDPVRRVTRSVQPIANPEYDISAETVQSVVVKLRNKRFSDVSFLKRYINRPMPIPTNFRQWFGHIKHNEPTRQFMLRLKFDDLMKVLGFMIQWINSITKNKLDSKQLQQWLLYIWIFMPNELPSPQISQLRDLGRKCQLSLMEASNSKIASLTMPTEIRDIPFPNQRDQLNAIEITLAVIAHRFGQRDLLTSA